MQADFESLKLCVLSVSFAIRENRTGRLTMISTTVFSTFCLEANFGLKKPSFASGRLNLAPGKLNVASGQLDFASGKLKIAPKANYENTGR